MKLGIVVQYFDFRNDVRQLIEKLSQDYEVILYAREEDLQKIDVEYPVRVIRAYNRTPRNRFWNLLYALFGNLPASKTNYYRWKRRRLDTYTRRLTKLREQALLLLSVRLPSLIDFDTYLKGLDFSDRTEIDDVDVFFSFTDVYDTYFLAHLRNEKKTIVTYVYSWDHAAKYHRFSRTADTYLTWNDHIKKDLTDLHRVEPHNVASIGSSQFAYIEEYKRQAASGKSPVFDFEYVYFGAAAGYLRVAEQEVRLVELLAETLHDVDPSVKLVVRPYPLIENQKLYESLASLPNIFFDQYQKEGESRIFTEDSIFEKFNKIEHAKAFVHIGSTMGLEASYFDTPVIHLDLQDVDFGVDKRDNSYIGHLIHSYHGEKYMLLAEYPNVVTKVGDLRSTLETALTEPERLLDYNRTLASKTELQSFDAFTEGLKASLEAAANRCAPAQAFQEVAQDVR